MKFSTQEDVDVPIADAFAMLCDFESFERAAMRHGAEVQRVDRLSEPGVGMAWKSVFMMRGKLRELRLTVVRFEPPGEMDIDLSSTGLSGAMHLELMALARSRTRITVGFEVRPLNLSARLLVQSLKLAKAALSERYKLRVAGYARDMETRYHRET